MGLFKPVKPSVLEQTPESLAKVLLERGTPAFHSMQVMDWIYRKGVTEFAQMTNLPKDLREWLNGLFCIVPAEILLVKEAGEGSEKLLLKMEDGSLVETVILYAPNGDESEDGARVTLCVSSQVGCAYGCKFCASGLDGWRRNLLPSEILAQVFCAGRHLAGKRGEVTSRTLCGIDNVVFMGMGEPLANYDNVMKAVTVLHADWGFGLGARRITISTSGLAPQILKLADEPVQFRLAVSLHGPSNDVRSAIMPVNRKYPLDELLPAIKAFSSKRGRMVTLEYILIEEVNDGLSQAAALVRIAQDLHAHVNLIPYNPVNDLAWKRPSLRRQKAFSDVLSRSRVSHTIRRQKGNDIDAACGQLRLKVEKARAAESGSEQPSDDEAAPSLQPQ